MYFCILYILLRADNIISILVRLRSILIKKKIIIIIIIKNTI